jgi:hypothetical protein
MSRAVFADKRGITGDWGTMTRSAQAMQGSAGCEIAKSLICNESMGAGCLSKLFSAGGVGREILGRFISYNFFFTLHYPVFFAYQ